MIAILGYLSEIEERIAQGWFVGKIMYHPVMNRYGRAYYYRYVE